MQRGARPVVYGDDRLWSQLPIDAHPYFQLSNDAIDRRGGTDRLDDGTRVANR